MTAHSSHRSNPVQATLLLLGLLTGASACREAPPDLSKRPHLVLVTVDSLRTDHLASCGYARRTLGSIDWLAERGALWPNTIAQATSDRPSMASLMTGRRLAQLDQRPAPDTPVLAELLGQAGYRTGAFVENPLLTKGSGFERGFQLFRSEVSKNALRNWFATITREERSFTWVHIATPRAPYAPSKSTHHFVRQGGGLGILHRRLCERISQREELIQTEASLARIERGINGYDDDLRTADGQIAALLDVLKRAGVWGHTAIIVTGTHGEALWMHERDPATTASLAGEDRSLDKWMNQGQGERVYQENIRVPLVLRVPPRSALGILPEQIENVDVLPTLLELARAPSPAGLHGRKLKPWGRDASSPGAAQLERTCLSIGSLGVTLLTPDGWKLVRPTEAGAKRGLGDELYKLGADGQELTNLAAEQAELVTSLGLKLDEALAGARAPAPGFPD